MKNITNKRRTMRNKLNMLVCLGTVIICHLLYAEVEPKTLDALKQKGFVAYPESPTVFSVDKDGEQFMQINFCAWRSIKGQWKYLGLRGKMTDKKNELLMKITANIPDGKLNLNSTLKKTGPRRFQAVCDLSVTKDVDLKYLAAAIGTFAHFENGKAKIENSDGSVKTVNYPFSKKDLGQSIRKLTLTGVGDQTFSVTMDPPCRIACDKVARIVIGDQTFKANAPRTLTLTFDFPADLIFHANSDALPNDPDFKSWFVFKPGKDHEKANEISMRDWLEAPAGKHGRIVSRADDLYYNGKPIKLWGANVTYSGCAPEKEISEGRARFYSKYGINAVRFHKYADGPKAMGIQAANSFAEFDSAALDRMDYQVAQYKKYGIYVKLSSTFHVKLGPDDRKAVPYMDEFGKIKKGRNRVSTPSGSIYFSRELQDLQITQIVKMLKHKNPYTGLIYAKDPVIFMVEMLNEDSIFWYETHKMLQKIPTLRKRASEQFCAWLKKRYGDEAGLLKAWGKPAFNIFAEVGFDNESLAQNSIVPAGNPWFFENDIKNSNRKRFLDTMLFLYETQNKFYDRYAKAIRATGYKGEILSSNWQAGGGLSHYYNLYSDSRIGLIDRHNYFGGGGGSRINNATMLRIPGSGMMSAGMQQVSNRPFMISEWIHVAPTEWGVEGPAIIGAYGMGLQGWDVSHIFMNGDKGFFSDTVARRPWDAAVPQILGVFPAVARQVLRGDVRQSPVTASRYVHLPSFEEGKIGFKDTVTQTHDVKTFNSDKVPVQTLAAVRSVIEFTDEYKETPVFDLNPYQKNGTLISATKQLRWKEGKSKLDGYFTIDSDATKAVVGFADKQRCELGQVTIKPECRYAAIYVVAQEKDKNIDTSKKLLVVAIARARNTDMKIIDGTRLLDKGHSPILLEPVKAEITIKKKGKPVVHVLDHAGARTGKKLKINNGTFTIDGAQDKTCYYLIEYPNSGD